MPFIPHTPEDVEVMLQKIGVKNVDDLFQDIPKEIFRPKFKRDLPNFDELTLSKHINKRAEQNFNGVSFLGAGSYSHYIPPTVWAIASRGEFMTAYTPYQAEASQGLLQLFWEYQTMMSSLMHMDVSNASLYEGSSSVFEAVMMILRQHRASPENSIVYLPTTLHPHYVQVLKSLAEPHKIQFIDVPYNKETGRITVESLEKVYKSSAQASCLILPQPNFFGQIEEADKLTDWSADNKVSVIGVVNPFAMTLLKPPGEWGASGAEIACGEGQPLGVPVSSGGPYFGFLCSKEKYLRQMPGRLIGKTIDKNGKSCFTLTLQAREQHIRRARATSNICTNQGLFVTAATIHMSLLGPQGLKNAAKISHARMRQLTRALENVGVKPLFDAPFFHERVFDFSSELEEFLVRTKENNLVPGLSLGKYFSELKSSLLVCTTELIDDEAIEKFSHLAQAEECLA
jgi:glycine dehydrogenase subunit 1